ncbi:MAG: hypothetical protein ACLRYR_12570 [Bifidobacterium dentium]
MADETSIDVSKKSVADLLGSGSKSRFMIPEYQRPYAWEQIRSTPCSTI